ncbi:MAG: AAA family ATPase, partial [Planctomycetes bacterium]|nr:AAA family ATPase [Planctomycetota bacterium]
MILKTAEIRNFRSIAHLTIAPRQLTTFVGKNSCGKSNILRALQFFFKASPKSAIVEDLCKFADDAGTWVECTFGDLVDREKEELGKYVRHDETIRVRRTLYLDGDRCVTKLHGYVQCPTEEWLQDDYPDYADMEKWTALGIDVTQYAEIGARGKLTKAGFKEFQEKYIAQNAATLEFSESMSETEFKGRQSTAARLLPHFIFVPAVGDIAGVIYGKQSSLLNEMVAAVIETAKTDPEYVAAQVSLSEAQDFVNPSPKRLGKLTLIEQDLADRLKSWPGTTVTIRTEVDDLARLLEARLQSRLARCEPATFLGEVVPWFIADIAGIADKNRVRSVAVAWLNLYLSCLFFDDLLDRPQDCGPQDIILAGLLLQRGITSLIVTSANPLLFASVLDEACADTAEAASDEIIRHRSRIEKFGSADLACVGRKVSLVHICVEAVLSLSTDANLYQSWMHDGFKSLTNTFQLLDDLTDWAEDYDLANMTYPLTLAVERGFL